jgi:hypothetical protein
VLVAIGRRSRMSSIIRVIPRFIREVIFLRITDQVNEVDCDDVGQAKLLILARLAALLQL